MQAATASIVSVRRGKSEPVMRNPFAPSSMDVSPLPGAHIVPRLVEEAGVVGGPDLLARRGRERPPQRVVHLVHAEVGRLVLWRHLIGTEQEAIGEALDER